MCIDFFRFFKKKRANSAKQVIFAFILTFALCMILVFAMVLNRSKVEKLRINELLIEKSVKVSDVMSKLMYKTQILSSLVSQNNGDITNFEQLAAIIIDDPSILSVLLAPDGIVSNVYPAEDVENITGLDLFADETKNAEVLAAKETGQFVLGGPFESPQGYQTVIGISPIYIDDHDGLSRFWGLVSITLRYPQALDNAGLNELAIQGLDYEIWRTNPDTGDKQIILTSGHGYGPDTNYVEKAVTIENAQWLFRILPLRTWYHFPETWIAFFISVCVSLLVSVVIKNNQDLKSMKSKLEMLSNTDSLTGIYNRRYFMASALKENERVIRTKSESFVILYDLDHFKKVNDTYGHQAGDKVLKETAARIKEMLRSYDLFARYGGEEFIILATDIDRENAVGLAERIRIKVSEQPVKFHENSIPVTVSAGIAIAAPENDIETAIACADKGLYHAKETGRNKSIFSDPGGFSKE